MKRFEMWLVNLDPTIGREIGKNARRLSFLPMNSTRICKRW